MPVCTASVIVPAGIDRTGDYLAHVPHLPEWTGFFRSVGEPEDERYPAESAMGPIQTWAEHNQLPDCAQEIAICSLIHGREEQASLLLHPAGTGTEVEFTVSLPDHADDTAARQQTARMHSELGTLRQLLEPQPARR